MKDYWDMRAASEKKMRIVLANGCFDILHRGHLLYLEEAASMGDILVVSVTKDAFVNKGPGRPTIGEDDRVALVGALQCVDHAFLVDGVSEALAIVHPHIFVKGADYRGKIEREHQNYCDANSIEIAFTSTPLQSSTKIINDRLRESQRL